MHEIKNKFIIDSHMHIYKNTYLILFLILLEFLQLFNETINSINRIKNIGIDSNFTRLFNYLNPVYYLGKIQTCNKYQDYNVCSFSKKSIIISFGLFIAIKLLFLIFMKIKNRNKNSNNIFEINAMSYNSSFHDLQFDSNSKKNFFRDKIFLLLEKFFAYYFDLLFHLFSYTILHFLCGVIIPTIYKFFFLNFSELAFDFLFIVIAIIITVSYLFYGIFYIFHFSLVIKFHKKVSLHYDNFFSVKFDSFLLLYKLMIILFRNFVILRERNFYVWVEMMITFLPMIFVFYILFRLFFLNRILFLINFQFNFFRIFLFTFNSVFAIFFLVFTKEMQHVFFLILTLISNLFIAFQFTKFLVNSNKKKIFEGKNLIYQQAYIVSIQNSKKQKFENGEISNSKLKEEIFQILSNHKMNCDNLKSDILCKICNEEFKYEKFLKNYFEYCRIKIFQEKYSETDIEIKKLLRIYYLITFKTKIKIHLILNLVKMLESKKVKNKLFFHNANLMKNYFILCDEFNDVRNFHILKIYEETENLLNKILIETSSVFENLKIEKDLCSNFEEIYRLRNKVMINFKILSKFKEFRCDKFSFATFKKVFENLFNHKIQENILNFHSFELKQILWNQFKNDKRIEINFDLKEENFIIKNVSKDLHFLKNKNFEDFIPHEISKELKILFLEKLKKIETDSFSTEFLIKKTLTNFLIRRVQMDCKIFYSSSDFEVIKIIGNYEINQENLILVEVEDKNLNNSNILKCSEEVSKILFLPKIFLNYSHTSIKFQFRNVFAEYNEIEEVEEYKDKNLFELDYSNFYSWMSYAYNSIQITDEDLETNLNLLKENADRKIKKLFSIKELYSIQSNLDPSKTFKLISMESVKYFKHSHPMFLSSMIKDISNSKNLFNNIMMNESSRNKDLIHMNELNESNEFNELNDSLFKIKENSTHTFNTIDPYHRNSSLSISQTINSNKTSSSLKKSKKFKKIEKLKKLISSSSFGKSYSITILFVICLIVYNLIFLIIMLANNKRLSQTHLTKIAFDKFRTKFYHSYSSVINNFFLYDMNKTEVIELFNSYYEDFNHELPTNFNFDHVVNEEILIKLDEIREGFVEFQEIFYSSVNFNEVSKIFEREFDYYQIAWNEEINEYALNKNILQFFESIKIFFNLAKIISMETENIRFLFTYIIDFKNGIFNFKNLEERSLQNNQIYAIEISINFINYLKTFEKIRNELNFYHSNLINYNLNFCIYFILSFQAFHIILIFCCFLQMKSISNFLETFSIIAGRKLSKEGKTKMIIKKLEILKNLNNLYLENPMKNLKKLKELKKEFEKNENLQKKRKILNQLKSEGKFKIFIDKTKIVSPIMNLLSLILIFYLIYSFSFLLINYLSHKSLRLGLEIFNYKLQIMDDFINNFNIAKINILTNNTDETVYQSITDGGKDESTYGTFVEKSYIRAKIEAITKRNIEINTLTKKYSYYSQLLLLEANLMNCEKIYSNEINDSILNSLYLKFEENKLKDYFKKLCLDNIAMQGDSTFNYLMDEVNYKVHIYLIHYEDENFFYPKVIEVHNLVTLTRLYFSVDWIFRPVQNYIIYSFILDALTDQKDNYFLLNIIMMVVNLFVDLLIMMLIFRKMVASNSHVSNYLFNFIEVIID